MTLSLIIGLILGFVIVIKLIFTLDFIFGFLRLIITLCLPKFSLDVLYFVIPWVSVLTVIFLYFLPVNTFKRILTLGTGVLVLVFMALTLKYFPDLYVVVNFVGFSVMDLIFEFLSLLIAVTAEIDNK